MSSTFFFFFGVPSKSRGSLSIYRPVLDMRKEIDREACKQVTNFLLSLTTLIYSYNPWRSSTELLLKLGVNYYD
jgi:hypothetical protein